MPDTPGGPPVPASGGIGAQLKQLLPMLPALLASAKGNPDAMGAFMEGYQRSMAQLQQREHAQTQMGMQQSEMQSQQARQAEQDRIAAEDRQRRMALERVTIGQTLAEAGGGAENPESASALIDSLYSQLQGLGTPEELAPMRDYAQHAASANISNRKKGEFRRWVSEDLPKSQFMQEIQAAGADADVTDALAAKAPRMLEIARQMRPGQERFKASELWTIAEALQPAPAAPRQRPVAAVGSFEDYIQRKYGDAPTPEQITEGRRVYQQSDDRPRVDVSVNAEDASDLAQQLVAGNIVPSMLSKRTANYNSVLAEANRVSLATTGKPYNAARAQTEYAAAQRFMAALNGPQQQRFRALAGAVVNTIDEVRTLSAELKNSGVPLANRAKLATYAQTMGNSPQGQLAARYIGAVNTLKEEFANLAQGGYAPTEAAWELANKQINGDYGVKQMDASLTEVQRLINFRMQAFENLTPYGVSADNPAVGGMGPSNVPPPHKVRLRFDAQGNPIP